MQRVNTPAQTLHNEMGQCPLHAPLGHLLSRDCCTYYPAESAFSSLHRLGARMAEI